MQELFPSFDEWSGNSEQIALATVVETWGSAPRGVGAKMALTRSGQMAGSVSGGCVEGAVVEAGKEVLKDEQPTLLHFGVADETAWAVGLACGGKIEIFVRPLKPDLLALARSELEAGRPSAFVTVIQGPPELLGREMLVRQDGTSFGTIGAGLDESASQAGRLALAGAVSQRTAGTQAAGAPVEFFVDVHMPPPRLVIVGGVHIAVALVRLAKTLGYRTVLVDPRRGFGNRERFPDVDELIQVWPDEAMTQAGLTASTAVAMLTHDPKLDDPALMKALPSPAFYVGALGSSRTNARRRKRLLEAGLSKQELDRLHAPIGLDLGGRSPEEIALSIMAEIVRVRYQGGR